MNRLLLLAVFAITAATFARADDRTNTGEFQCAEGERELVAEKIDTGNDESVSEVTCDPEEFVTRCQCEGINDLNICRNVRVRTRKCTAYYTNEDDSGWKRLPVQAKACCRLREKNDVVFRVSEPRLDYEEEWEFHSSEKARGKKSPAAECPEDTELVYCNLFKNPSTAFPDEVATVEGNRCSTTEACESCSLELVCQQKEFQQVDFSNLEKAATGDEFVCGEGEREVTGVMSDGPNNGESIALCDGREFVTRCGCEPEEGGYCSHMLLRTRKCRAYIIWLEKIIQVKAKACCRPKGNAVISRVQEPESMPQNHWSNYKVDYGRFMKAPAAECPEGTELVYCNLYKIPSTAFPGEVATVEGNRCTTTPACEKCVLELVCKIIAVTTFAIADLEKAATGDEFTCGEGEREVIAVSTADMGYFGDESTALCESNEFVTRCGCEPDKGEYCASMLLRTRKCIASHLYLPREKKVIDVQAKACCRPKGNAAISRVQEPKSGHTYHWHEYSMDYARGIKAPAAECPEGTELVYCNLYKVPSTAFPGEVATVEGNRCTTTPACERCTLELVCKK